MSVSRPEGIFKEGTHTHLQNLQQESLDKWSGKHYKEESIDCCISKAGPEAEHD
jgi:hypothetical protein